MTQKQPGKDNSGGKTATQTAIGFAHESVRLVAQGAITSHLENKSKDMVFMLTKGQKKLHLRKLTEANIKKLPEKFKQFIAKARPGNIASKAVATCALASVASFAVFGLLEAGVEEVFDIIQAKRQGDEYVSNTVWELFTKHFLRVQDGEIVIEKLIMNSFDGTIKMIDDMFDTELPSQIRETSTILIDITDDNRDPTDIIRIYKKIDEQNMLLMKDALKYRISLNRNEVNIHGEEEMCIQSGSVYELCSVKSTGQTFLRTRMSSFSIVMDTWLDQIRLSR